MDETAAETDALVYHFRPRLVGGEVLCRLGGDYVEFFVGSRHTRIAYPMIESVRLSYRPTNMSMKRYLMEIWPRGGIKTEIASVSFLANLEVRDQSAEYRKLVHELHRKIREARGDCKFYAGFPAWRWWPLAAVGVAAAIAGVIALGYVLFSGQLLGALLLVALGGFFLWQIAVMVLRNRPEIYSSDAIPEYVLPKT